MSKFRPTRASPPFKPTRRLEHALSTDISRSSTHVSVTELAGLSHEDIDLLDAVIDRAGPSATTFLSVFKAYNDILRERGLDPQEVVYYGKLLKLGTMKGKSWADKWNTVKAQHDHTSREPENNRPYGQLHPENHVSGRATRLKVPPASNEDTLSAPSSHAADPDAYSSFEKSLSAKQSKRRLRAQSTASDSADDSRRNSLILLPDSPSVYQQHRPWTIGGSLPSDSENTYAPSPTDFAPTRYSRPPIQTSFPHKVSDTAAITPASARKVIMSARERRGSVINEEDAWNKIKMERDEADADVFRKTRLMERCWKVWNQLYRWIVTTNDQIADARDNLIIRIYLQRWRKVILSRQELYQRISIFSDNRCRRKSWSIWRHRLRRREQDKWRQDMRQKMKTIREKRELTLCKDAWAKWRQSYRSHLSGNHYTERLVRRFYDRWKKRLSTINHLEMVADDAFRASEATMALRFWDWWRTARQLQSSEQIMSERIDLRLMRDAMSIWQKNMSAHSVAMEFYELILVKSSMRSWKAAQDRLYNMESQALKHLTRQDGLLIRAVFRVWKARKQGKVVERHKASNLIYAAWLVWKERLQQQNRHNGLALAFVMRSDSSTTASLFCKWRQIYGFHRDAQLVAIRYNTKKIYNKALFFWRVKLHKKLKMVRIAKMAVSFFSTRRAWRTWHEAMNQRATERRLAEFEKRRIERAFYTWLLRARQVKQERLAETLVQGGIKKRILRCTLMVWTNRVIAIKTRELDVAQSYNTNLQTVTFKKWQKVYAHRLEVLSLLQSYLLVKREENMRRIFTRWLGLARIHRHRRLILKEKEDEIKFFIIASFWDKWRDRFSTEKLRPVERVVMIQTKKNALFRAFGLWHSKTKSLPAIRFHAHLTKAKYFKIWWQAMPRARQATKARERDRHATLNKYLDRWVQIHRTKMALKAVARARYLRLPTAAPRQTRSVPHTSGHSPDIIPRMGTTRTFKEPVSHSMMQSDQLPIAFSLLRPRPFSERSPTLKVSPRTREPSPTRSRASSGEMATSLTRAASSEAGANEGVRSRLWQELREMQRNSRPSSLQLRPRQ